ADSVLEFRGKLAVLAVDDRKDVFLQQYLKQRSRRAAGSRTQRTRDLGRKITKNGNDAVGIRGKSLEKMTIILAPMAGREVGSVRCYIFKHWMLLLLHSMQ